MEAGYKFCPGCKITKPIDAFHIAKDRYDGRKAHCKECRKERDKGRSRMSKLPPGVKRSANINYIYVRNGPVVSKETYNALHQIQNGVCAICGKPETVKQVKTREEPRKLSIDHNHQTGQIRGLLCLQCNLWLGLIENPSFDDFIPLAKKYLATHRS